MLYHLKSLRPFINGDQEYHIRRGINKLIPVRSRVDYDNLFHCATWKTGSQWFRLVLSDPRFYRYTGLDPYPKFNKKFELNNCGESANFQNRVVTNLYGNVDSFERMKKSNSYKGFFVYRNPTDLLVSWYFSTRYSHDETPRILELREGMEGFSHAEGLIFMVERFDEIANELQTWMTKCNHDDRFVLVDFDDFFKSDVVESTTVLFEKLAIDIPRSTLAAIVSTYRKDKLSPKKSTINDKYSSLGHSLLSKEEKLIGKKSLMDRYPELFDK